MSEQLPKTYKAAVCQEGGKPLEIVEKDLKMPEEGQVRRLLAESAPLGTRS
jgi:Zn-dependent alcohol dehydrogenase